MTILPELERAVLETLAYSDIFDYPLRLDELHRYLTFPASPADLVPALAELNGRVTQADGYYHLAGRAEIVALRRERERRARPLFDLALLYGRVLGSLPFIRMVGLTGSLAMLNPSIQADMDYMLVTQPGRLWIARAFAVFFGRLVRPFGHRICSNLVISENALAWPLHDLYSAREMCQMVPITGLDVYRRLRAANAWTDIVLPNAGSSPKASEASELSSEVQLANVLRGGLGDHLERWAMNLQMKWISRRTGFGEETIFNAEVCQGNFDHHRERTQEMFQKRLSELGVDSLLSAYWQQDRMRADG